MRLKLTNPLFLLCRLCRQAGGALQLILGVRQRDASNSKWRHWFSGIGVILGSMVSHWNRKRRRLGIQACIRSNFPVGLIQGPVTGSLVQRRPGPSWSFLSRGKRLLTLSFRVEATSRSAIRPRSTVGSNNRSSSVSDLKSKTE